MDGINVTEAFDQGNAIVIDPNTGVIAKIAYLVTGNHSVEVSYLKTVFIVADIDATSQTDIVDVTLSSGDNFTFVQTWKFNNFVGHKNIALITGVYELRYDLYYSVKGQDNVIKGLPFYVEFDASPVTSVFGIVSTVALAATGISFIGLANSLKGSIDLELGNSVGETKVSPTEKLKGYYRGKTYSMAQTEISNLLFGYASSLWKGEKCPQCEVDWPKDIEECPSCQITAEEAKELYTTSLVEKALTAIKEVVDSVSGLSLKGIADKIDEGVNPTTNIVSVVTFSGLTLVKPRVSKNWSKKRRSLIFTGVRTSIYTLFWVQACGIGVVSITALIVALLSGFLIHLIISRITGNGLKAKISEFWEKRQSELE
ncbi:hypothetical protein ACFL0D_03455 [Thermoproteota archaeon]